MTHIYLRQADVDSIRIIQEECGKRLIQKTSLAITEGGMSSELSYIQGGIVHQGLGLSSTKTVTTEENPFVEIDELKQLPNNVAIVLPSNGDRTLPATISFLRPLWVQKRYPSHSPSTPWHDWPAELRTTYDLDTIPQELNWSGWGTSEPLDEGAVVPAGSRLGKLIQPADEEPVVSGAPPLPPLVVTPQPSLVTLPGLPSAPQLPPPTPPRMFLHASACSVPEQEPTDSPREGDPFDGPGTWNSTTGD